MSPPIISPEGLARHLRELFAQPNHGKFYQGECKRPCHLELPPQKTGHAQV